MKKARTLITRAAVVAVVLVGLSAQAASASSGSSKGDRGKSCWAHSRHKAHKHATGHDHRCDHDHDDRDDDDRDDDDRDDAAPTTTIPTTTIPTTTTIPRPASSESASPVTGSSPSTSVAISPRIGGEIVVIEEPAATEPARENTVVTPGTGGGTSSPTTTTPEETPGNVDSPSAGSDTAPEGDQAFMPEDDQPAAMPSSGVAGEQDGSLMLTDSQMNESLTIATSQVRQQATMQLWWVLLVLLAVAAETARRVRRNGALNAQGAE
jgi:hypothetical protein